MSEAPFIIGGALMLLAAALGMKDNIASTFKRFTTSTKAPEPYKFPEIKIDAPEGLNALSGYSKEPIKPKSKIQSIIDEMEAARPLLEMIGEHESNGNYNVLWGGKEIPLTQMTVGAVLQYQKDNNPPGPGTAAAGKYQFINKTLSRLVKKLKIDTRQKFTPALQDRLAYELLKERGFLSFIQNRMSLKQFMLNLSKEWASLPKDMGGRSYYRGDGVNFAGVRPEVVVNILEKVRA